VLQLQQSTPRLASTWPRILGGLFNACGCATQRASVAIGWIHMQHALARNCTHAQLLKAEV
jgi:hypothetical protein